MACVAQYCTVFISVYEESNTPNLLLNLFAGEALSAKQAANAAAAIYSCAAFTIILLMAGTWN
jgi:hypothetical protein